MRDELRDNARQHGVAAADFVADKIQNEGMAPVRPANCSTPTSRGRSKRCRADGASREELIAWIRAVDAAFDERFAELAAAFGDAYAE